MNEKFIVIDATDDIVIGGFGNLEGNLGLLKYSYEEISQKMKENNNKEEDIRLVNSLLDSIRELQQENQKYKEEIKELELMLGLKQKRKLINRFDKEYNEENKKKHPNENHVEIIPDAEEVYKRYYAMKNQLKNCYCNRTDCSSRIKDSKKYDSLVQKVEKHQKEFIEWLKEKSYQTHFQLQTALIYEKVLSKYKEIIGEEK